LKQARRVEDLNALLWDPNWLEKKLRATDIHALIRDFDLLEHDPDAQLVSSALKLSAHVLGRDKQQLLPQLAGRLLSCPTPKIRKFLLSQQ
jgi:hypothetical protein